MGRARSGAAKIRDLDREHRFDRGILPQMAELGLLGASVPAEYGGAGMDYISLGLISEELEYVDTSLRVIMSVHAGLNCLTLLAWGTEDQKQRYLVPQAQGKKIASYGLTEPAAGSDVRGIQTDGDQARRSLRAERREDVDLARRRRRQLPRVRLDRRRKKKRRDPAGLSAFIVERGFKGFSSGPLTQKWGILAGNTGFFKMDDVEVPAENLVGREGEGFKIAMFALDQGRYTVGGRRDRPDPRLPRRQREVRARAADVRRRDRAAPARQGNDRADGVGLSGLAAAVDAVRLAEERGPAQHARNRPREVVRDRRLRARGGDAVQIHGANGYSDEYPVGRFYRNCKGAVIYEGTREIHKLMQADYVLGATARTSPRGANCRTFPL